MIVLGIIGYPVSHSISPLMHRLAAAENNIDLVYSPFEVKPENIKSAIEGIRSLGIRGINVTVPHKEALIPFLDELSDEARFIGAVNIVINENGKLSGFNSDGIGFVDSLKALKGIDIKGKKILIYGAGGSAKAISYSLAKESANLMTIAARTIEKADKLAEKISTAVSIPIETVRIKDQKKLFQSLENADIIVNATSAGMKNVNVEKALLNFDMVKKGTVVVDIVYNPLKTEFLKEAEKYSLDLFDGLNMLIYQGNVAFKYFTGKSFLPDKMRTALLSYIL